MTSFLHIGDSLPLFQARCYYNGGEHELKLADLAQGKWLMLVSNVCARDAVDSSEYSTLIRMYNEFKQRDINIVGVSTSSIEEIKKWSTELCDMSGSKSIPFPIISDESRSVCSMLNMVDVHCTQQPACPLRVTYLVDPKNFIRAMYFYPPSVGRNFFEILRTSDALHLHDMNMGHLGTPANWRVGDDVYVCQERIDISEARKKYGDFKTSMYGYIHSVSTPQEFSQMRSKSYTAPVVMQTVVQTTETKQTA